MAGKIDHRKILSETLAQDIEKVFIQVKELSVKQINELVAQSKSKLSELSKGTIDAESIKQQTELVAGLERIREEKRKLIAVEKEYERAKAAAARYDAQIASAPIGSYNRINAELNKNIFLLKNLSTQEKTYTQDKKRLTTEIQKQDAALKKLDAEMGRYQRNVGNYKSGISGLVTSLKSFAASFLSVYTAINLGKEIFTKTLKLDVLSQSFKYLIQDTAQLTQSQNFLTQVTKDYGLELITTTESYLRFRASIQGANFDLNKADKIFNSVAKAGAVLGLSSQRMELVFLALEQMISKGTISAEELRRQLGDNLPGAMQIMADALGVSIAELTKMIKANQVLATDALPKFAAQLEKTYGIENVNKIDNMQSSVNRLKNAWTNLIKGIGASGGFTSFLDFLTRLLTANNKEMGESIKLYNLYDKELEQTFALLKNTNTSHEARIRLIDEINTKYGKYLPNLLKEESSLGEIESAYKEINKQMRINVLQKAFHEEITKILEDELQAQKNLVTNEIEGQKLSMDYVTARDEADKASIENKQKMIGLTDQLNNVTVQNTQSEIEQTREKFKRIAAIYGIAFEEIEKIVKDNDPVGGVTDETLEGLEEELRLATGNIEILEAKIALNNYLIKKSKDPTKTKQLEYENLKYQEQIQLIKELIDYVKLQEEWTSEAQESIEKGIEQNNKALEKDAELIGKELDDFEQYYSDFLNRQQQFGQQIGLFNKDTYEEELSFLDEFHKQGLLSEEDYLIQRVTLWMRYNQDLMQSVEMASQSLFNMIGEINAGIVDSAQREVDVYEDKLSQLRGFLDEEKRLKDEGKANDYDRMVDTIAQNQRLQDEANDKLEKAKKREAQIQLAAQASDIITATADIIAGWTEVNPIAGVFLAMAQVAAMISAFASYKNKIKSMSAYAEGTEYVEGPGTETSDSIHARLSKGERVVNAKTNRLLGDFPNDKLPEAVNIWRLNFGSGGNYQRFDTTSELLREYRKQTALNAKLLRNIEGKADILPAGETDNTVSILIVENNGRKIHKKTINK